MTQRQKILLTKRVATACRILFALVFIFSGFVKAVDPLGSMYKIQDYLAAMGTPMSYFSFLALPGGIALSAVEFLTGFCLLFGIGMKRAHWMGILFMVVMTLLTLWIALKNPVSDCGCFGDALVIGNWTTFWKNIVLSALIAFSFWNIHLQRGLMSENTRVIFGLFALFYILGLSIYCYRHLPIFDFRPYKIGTYIPEKMTLPDDAKPDKYLTTFLYEKDGVTREITLDEYATIDSTWTFVDQKSVLIEKGDEAAIHDFSITLPVAGDITDEVLSDPSYTFLLISGKVEDATRRHSKEINAVYEYSQVNGYKFYCLNASLPDQIEDFIEETNAKYPFATTDYTTLKTIVRSNPGLVLLKGGTILNKWHHNDIPIFEYPLEESPLGEVAPSRTARTWCWLGLTFGLPLLLLGGIDKLIRMAYRGYRRWRRGY